MDEYKIITFRYKNIAINHAIFSPAIFFTEIIAFLLCEQVMHKGYVDEDTDGKIFDYIEAGMDPLDIHVSKEINDEVSAIVAKLSDDYIYQSLIDSPEVYLKYEYDLYPTTTELRFYLCDQ